MIPSPLQPLANHLWQSTLFAAVAGLLTLALRKNRAQSRYWLWLAASVKFLIPFSLLVGVGSHWGRHTAPAITPPLLSYVIEQASQPFSVPTPLATITAAPGSSLVDWVPVVLATVWALGFAALICSWWRRWRTLRTALRTASPLDLQIGMDVRISPAFGEPGVFGVHRPVLLLPAGITDSLTSPQLKAIVAHELCHIRRRDNLATAIHMGVEALFWFHPLVWWLGARLMEERERACDEGVLLTGSEPQAYAEGILTVCELYLESPLPCVSGATGASLKERIETIMLQRVGVGLSASKRIILAAVGAAAIAAPIATGILNTAPIKAQSAAEAMPQFDVVSIKPNQSDRPGGNMHPIAGGFDARNLTVNMLIQSAYRLKPWQIFGGPGWATTDGYDIEAKGEGNPSLGQKLEMLRPLLADRFQLKFHRETRQMPLYSLVVAKGGPKLQSTAAGERGYIRPGKGILEGKAVTMSTLADFLGGSMGESVVDKTSISGSFDIRLEWTPTEGERDFNYDDRPIDPGGSSIFSAIQAQLGLKLEAGKAPVEVMVIDHIERPSKN